MTSRSFFVSLIVSLVFAPVLFLAPARAYVYNAPTLVSPSTDQVLTNYPRNTSFGWSAVSGATSYELEVACDVCVSKTNKWQGAKTYTVFGTTFSTLAPGSDNQFRWRVRAKDSSSYGDWSDYRYFSFKTGSSNNQTLSAPTITSPYNGQKITSDMLQLSWTNVSSAGNFNYEIQQLNAQTQVWSSVITNNSYNQYCGSSQSTCQGSVNVGSFGDGQYRVRIRAISGSITGSWSIWNYFDLARGSYYYGDLYAPTLISPQDESQVTSNYVYLDWSDVNLADSYEYQVTRYNYSTWDTVADQVVSGSNAYVSLSSGSYGQYSYRVRSIKSGQYSNWSDYFQFNYSSSGNYGYSVPYINSPFAGENFTDHNINVSWSSVSGAVSYQVNVNYKSGSYWYEERTQDTSNTNLSLYMPYDNSYQVRVRAKFSDNNYSNWSDWKQFLVGQSGNYSTTPLTISSPSENQYFSSGSYVTLGWYAPLSSGNIDHYEVAMEYQSSNYWYTEGNYSTTNNSYSKYLSQNNSYRFRVRAVYTGGTYTDWSDYRDFTVGTSGSNYSAPTIYSPTDNQYFSNNSTVNFNWYSLSNVLRYEVAVEYQSGSSWNAEGTYNATGNSYSKYFTQNNAYRVRVRAVFNDYTTTNWSDYRYFSVGTSGSNYSAPTIYSPTDNQYFSSNSSVNIAWYSLSNVLRYEVAVEYQSGSSWNAEGTYNATSNSYSKYFSLNNAYRVRVRAVFNDYTTTNWSDYRYFSVGSQQSYSDLPVISAPTNNQVFTNGSVAVDWNDVALALRYEMTVEYQTGGNWYTETNYTNLTSSYQQLSLFYHTNYRVKVRAVFVQSTGSWSDYRNFSVQ